MVDLVLSSDTDVPMALAKQPSYAGKTVEDFVEDMLTLGGRISNTETIKSGRSAAYSFTTHIPLNIDPGVYFLAAVADSPERGERDTRGQQHLPPSYPDRCRR